MSEYRALVRERRAFAARGPPKLIVKRWSLIASWRVR
jgi:hypothetical protein